jgi:hypothetical protein
MFSRSVITAKCSRIETLLGDTIWSRLATQLDILRIPKFKRILVGLCSVLSNTRYGMISGATVKLLDRMYSLSSQVELQ